ncbi:type II and III secretion system protein family protein [Spongorhabdus nitratireducens]
MTRSKHTGRVLLIKLIPLISCFYILFFSTLARAQDTINLAIDEARPLKYATPIDTVFIANPDIADYRVVKGNQIIVFGRAVGQSSLLLFDERGRTIDSKMLVINKDLRFIRQQLAARFPNDAIQLTNLGDQVVLSGTVTSEQTRKDIYYLTGELLQKEFEQETISWEDDDDSYDIRFLNSRTYRGLINNIEIKETKQVSVRLTIAEVSHSFIQHLGVKWGTLNSEGNLLGGGNGEFLSMLNTGLNSRNIARYINAVNDDSMGQILAEPSLSVISGETASFLAGGEMPIITFVNDSQNITYKEFGVKLDLAAEVLRDDKINLTMMPEVSAIDPQNSNTKLDIPAFKTRRARTTVQLGDGESFVLGGLLNSEDREALSKIPLAGDIPVLGAMFRNTRDERQKTELIIVATVNLIQPVQPQTIQLPRLKLRNSLLRFFNLKKPPPGTPPPPVNRRATSILGAAGFKR